MKNQKIYDEALNLIKLREVKQSNLKDAETTLNKLVKKDSSCAWAYGLLSQVCYWRGEVADPDERLEIYEQGVDYAKSGLEIDEDNLESNFWLSVNYGLFGKEKGMLEAMRLIDPIEKHARKALEVDESYFYGAPLRVLGRFYNQLPSWPISRGDNKKALDFMLKALKHGPKFYLNHIYIADVYISTKNKDKAREHLQWVVNAPLSPNHEKEDSRDKQIAKDMLKNI